MKKTNHEKDGANIVRHTETLKRKDKGQATLEFALVIPLFVLVLVGTAETGILMHDYLLVQIAAREGARYGAVGHSESEIQQRVLDTAPSLDPAKFTIAVTNAQGDRGEQVTVDLSYDVDLITPMMETLFGQDPFPVSSQVIMRIE